MSTWTIKPYANYKFKGEPYYGYKRWNYDRIDELAEIIKKANKNGLSMQFYAYGSGSARYALDAIEKAQEGIENADFRNAISHLMFVDKEDIPRFAKLNVMPVVAPQWYIFDSIAVNAEKLIYGPDTYNKDELFENIKKAANEYPKEKRPYFVYNMYHAETFGAASPHKEDIDKIISDRPARINDDSGHGCVYNSIALDMLKDENGVPHSDFPIAGQTFFKDEKGEYTGVAFQTIQNGDIGCMEAATKMEGDVEYLYNLDKQGKLYFYFEPTILLNNCDMIDDVVKIAKEW